MPTTTSIVTITITIQRFEKFEARRNEKKSSKAGAENTTPGEAVVHIGWRRIKLVALSKIELTFYKKLPVA